MGFKRPEVRILSPRLKKPLETLNSQGFFNILSHRLQIKNDAACGEKGFCCLGFPLKEGIAVAYSKTTMRAVDKYVRNNYDRIEVKVPKGRKQAVEACARERGESQRPG